MSDRRGNTAPFYWTQRDVEFDLSLSVVNREAAELAEQLAASERVTPAAALAARQEAAEYRARWRWFGERAAAIAGLLARDVEPDEAAPPPEWNPIALLLSPRPPVAVRIIDGPYDGKQFTLGTPLPGLSFPAVWIFRCENGDDVVRYGFPNEPPATPDGGELLGRYAHDETLDAFVWSALAESPPAYVRQVVLHALLRRSQILDGSVDRAE